MRETGEVGAAVEDRRSLTIGSRAMEMIHAYGASAAPRAYEVWYTYVSGHKPAMNEAIKRLTQDGGTLSDAEVDRLHEAHLAPGRFTDQAEKAGTTLIGEIDQVMEMIDQALGSTQRYGQSLQDISKNLSGPVDRGRIREVLESLVLATRDVQGTNRTLEMRLRETRGEVESLRDALEMVRIEALTDALTGLANRKHFEEMLVKAVDHAALAREPLALVVIDIDRFKHFNDTYGHLTGDQVLRLVSATMRENVAAKATLARFGGEEFGVVLPACGPEEALATAEQIRRSVMGRELVKRSTGESLGKVTVSLGIAHLRRGDTAVSLLERADQCMFAAKRAGRNQTATDAEGQLSQDWAEVA